MPEMYGETALFYEPGDTRRMAAQVRVALTLDADRRSALQAAAHRRAAGFSWQRTMEGTVRELLRAAGRSDAQRDQQVAA